MVLLDDGCVYSHHASDPLNDGRTPHDSFGVLALLEHGGDMRAARAAAREELCLTTSRKALSW